MNDNVVTLPWDYFLTNYERDLLNLTTEDALSKYPEISKTDLETQKAILQENQAVFTSEMDKIAPACESVFKIHSS